jgi:hypothetical protein
MPRKFTTIAHRNCKALCRIVSLGLKYSGQEAYFILVDNQKSLVWILENG